MVEIARDSCSPVHTVIAINCKSMVVFSCRFSSSGCWECPWPLQCACGSVTALPMDTSTWQSRRERSTIPPGEWDQRTIFNIDQKHTTWLCRREAEAAQRRRRLTSYTLMRPRTSTSLRNRYMSKIGASIPSHFGHGALVTKNLKKWPGVFIVTNYISVNI